MNFRINQGPTSFTDNKLGMSSASRLKNSFRSNTNYKIEMGNEENNFGEV